MPKKGPTYMGLKPVESPEASEKEARPSQGNAVLESRN